MYFIINIDAKNISKILKIVFNEILDLLNEFLYFRHFCIYVCLSNEIDFYFFHIMFLRRYDMNESRHSDISHML